MSILPRPDLVVEANFFDTLDGQGWTDLSSYVEVNQTLSMSRRRQLLFDEVSAGAFSAFLDNSSGIFNNDRTDLPYAGLIGIDIPIRMRARWPSVELGATVNLISDNESIAGDTDYFVSEAGTLDVETVNVPTGQTTAIIWYTGVLPTTGIHLLT